jgi:hypothetical protein
MKTKTLALSIGLLKTASAAEKAEAAGAFLRRVAKGSGEAGAGLARGLGTNEKAGRVAGYAALAGGTYLGGRKAKQKYDEAKYRLLYT